MSTHDRRLVCVLGSWAILTAVACAIAYGVVAPGRGDPPPEDAARWAIATLERFRRDEPIGAAPRTARTFRAPAPIVVLAFVNGRPIGRSAGERTLEAAVRRAIREFAVDPALARGTGFREPRDARARFSITVPLGDGRSPVAIPGLRSFAYVPTRDAFVVRYHGHEASIVPDEMVARGLVAGAIPTGLPELDVGVDVDSAIDALAADLGVDRESLAREGTFLHRRVRTLSADVYPRRAPPSLANARRGMNEAAGYLKRHLNSFGLFRYEVHAVTGDVLHGDYLLARHAGSAYFLAQVARIERNPELREAAETALAAMLRRSGRTCGAPDTLCFREYGRVDGGTAALALIAFSELELAEPDPAHRAAIELIGRFLLSLQRPDGELMHLYDEARGRPVDVQLPYFSGEIALAFLRANEVTGDARYARAAERALRYLGERSWNFPAKHYLHAEEHWTCIAAGEARGRIDDRAVSEFCRSVYAWNEWAQLAPDESPFPVEGNYGLTFAFAPRYPALGTRLESFVELYRATLHDRRPIPGMRSHIERGISSAIALQLLPGPTRHISVPLFVRGGFTGSYTDPIVRIDHVQHVGSALARWVELLEDERRAPHVALGAPRVPRR